MIAMVNVSGAIQPPDRAAWSSRHDPRRFSWEHTKASPQPLTVNMKLSLQYTVKSSHKLKCFTNVSN